MHNYLSTIIIAIAISLTFLLSEYMVSSIEKIVFILLTSLSFGYFLTFKNLSNIKASDKLNTLMNTNDDLLFFKDKDFNYIDCNTEFLKLVKKTKEEVIGSNDFELFSKEKATLFREMDMKMLEKNEISNNYEWVDYPNGRQAYLQAKKIPFYYNKTDIGVLGMTRDITEAMKDKIAAEESSLAKSEFLASMSHEIRTPLNAILGFVTILQKNIKDETSKGYLDIIDSSGKSLLTIINDILDFSKMQSGKFTIDKHDVNIVDELSNSILLFTSKAYAKYLNYHVYIDPKMPSILKVDVGRINQIISNLLSNAIKFTPMYGLIKVSITYVNEDLIISVQDSGIGIAKENIDKVFSAFSQADSSTTRKYGGTGLGLSISSTLAKLMEGTLIAESEVGIGSIFTLTLPTKVINSEVIEFIDKDIIKNRKIAILNNNIESQDTVLLLKQYLHDFGIESILLLDTYQENGYDLLFFIPDDEYNEMIVENQKLAIALLKEDTIILADREHIHPLHTPFVPKVIVEIFKKVYSQSVAPKSNIEITMIEEIQFNAHLLVVEDNVTNQMLIKLLLTDYGITFAIANDGVEAVELFKKYKFDMVLMDENMPNKNGIEAMLEIKEYEKQNSLSSIPIIALTANALQSDQDKFKAVGMDGFVPKPIDNKILESELKKYLKVI